MTGINIHTNDIARTLPRWVRNRDMIEGEDAVKLRRETYLPRLSGMLDNDYDAYLKRTPFFPAASRTHDGMKGLVFRKPPIIKIPPALASIFDTITPAGHTVEDLAEDLMSETLITGFTVLLADYPSTVPPSVDLATQIGDGYRPFLSLYQAEHILEITPAVVGNVQKIVRVRLLEDDTTVRELILDETGVYRVIIHGYVEGVWTPLYETTPTKNGKPLDFIPLVLVTTNKARAYYPVKGPLDDVCRTNLQLYLEQADAKNSRYYSSAPILYIKGAAEIKDLTITPGTVLQFPTHSSDTPVDLGFAEFSGAGQQTLENAVVTLKEELAQLGSRILATEKLQAETAEALSIRRASEHATLGALARAVSRKLQEALNLIAWWLDAGEVEFALSTDFLPMPLTATEMQVLLQAVQTGKLSVETWLAKLVDGEQLPENFDIEAELARLDNNALNLDRPTVPDPATNLTGNAPSTGE